MLSYIRKIFYLVKNSCQCKNIRFGLKVSRHSNEYAYRGEIKSQSILKWKCVVKGLNKSPVSIKTKSRYTGFNEKLPVWNKNSVVICNFSFFKFMYSIRLTHILLAFLMVLKISSRPKHRKASSRPEKFFKTIRKKQVLYASI